MARQVVSAADGAELAAVREALLDDEALVRAVASGSRRNTVVPFRRVEVRYVDLRAGRQLQVTSYDDTSAHTRNVPLGEPTQQAVDDLLSVPFANWHVTTTNETVQLRVTKKGRPLLHRGAPAAATEPDRAHDRPKPRRLAEDDEVFTVLGLSTADGRLKPSRTAKFRQVQDFLAALEPVLAAAVELGPADSLSAERPLRVVDLGCGNAYLTFAAVRYLSAVKQLPVSAVGVDVKSSARSRNRELAEQLDLIDRMQFVDSTICDAELAEAPDLVMALHACDTATDEALARAVRWRAPVIVAAPCCHHDIQRQLTSASTPERYRLLTRHGILRERLADVLTDALRAAILRLVGYRVEVIEFVDPEHTPRNALIRAVRTDAPPSAATVAAYEALIAEWSVTPALAAMLAGDYPVLAASADSVVEHP